MGVIDYTEVRDMGFLASGPVLACASVAVIKRRPDQLGGGDGSFGLHFRVSNHDQRYPEQQLRAGVWQ